MAQGNVEVRFTGDAASLEREIIKLQAKAQQLQDKLRDVGGSGRKSADDLTEGFGGKALTSLMSYAAGVVSLNAAISAGKAGWQNWLANIREVSGEATKAAGQMLVLATMQEGGSKAANVSKAIRLAQGFGVTDRGLALDTVQSMQAARGDDFNAGMKSAAAIFASTKVGISLEKAREAEIFGASLGVAPGASVRRGYITGVISPRSPEEVIGAAPAMRFWNDNVQGWAAAGVLSAAVPPAELDTYVRAGGYALSGTEDKQFAQWQKRQGVGGNQMAILRALRRAGIDTPEKLAKLGIGEIRRQQAVSALVQNLPDMERYIAEIERRDKPGLFEAERGGVEAELPGTRLARESEILAAKYRDEMVMGPDAIGAQVETKAQLIRGLAFRKMRKLTTGPFGMYRTVDEQGRSTVADEVIASMYEDSRVGRRPGQPTFQDRLHAQMEAISGELDQPFSETQGLGPSSPAAVGARNPVGDRFVAIFEKVIGSIVRLDTTLGGLRSGPLLAAPGEDR